MMPVRKDDRRYTYADYYGWDDGTRWELIEGVPYHMSPGPTKQHQRISRKITTQVDRILEGKPCELFYAPFDVRLNAEEEDNTVCQPDLLVVCDESKLDDKGCKGAPDFVVEILSPSTIHHDKVVKYEAYRKAGVREYWIVDPEARTVCAHILKDGEYFMTAYAEKDMAPVSVLNGCKINLQDVFSE